MMIDVKAPQLYRLLCEGERLQASDLHLVSGNPPVYRINGELYFANALNIDQRTIKEIIKCITNDDQQLVLKEQGEIDFAFTASGGSRYRVNAFKELGNIAMALRFVPADIPDMNELCFPSIMKNLAQEKNGLIIISGATGSGKSTTLASMLDWINRSRSVHILTLEDPIEFFHKSKRSLITQREIPHDSKSFASALRAALREDPDILMVGEMRDCETAAATLNAAETGHLVFTSLHTSDAIQTVERIVDLFPPHQQIQIRYQLSLSLRAVVAQKLLPLANKPGRIAALEILLGTPAVANMIRNSKTHQLFTVMQTGKEMGMQTMNMAIAELAKAGIIASDEVMDR